MYILGIHGWEERTHDASACLIKDGKIIAMAEEERFTRKKHAYDSLPINAAAFCLGKAKITLNQVKYVACGWDLPLHYKTRKLDFPHTNKKLIETFFPKKYFTYSRYPKIIFVPHHLAHAASSYFASGFKEAAILIIDGQGETQSTSLFSAKKNRIELIKQFPIIESLGYMFEAACEMVGLGTEDAGKLMGLAPYGKAGFSFDFVKLKSDGYSLGLKGRLNLKKSADEQAELINKWHKLWKNKFKLIPKKRVYDFKQGTFEKKKIKFDQRDKDFAASVQTYLEKVIIHLTKIVKKRTKSANLVLGGGVALNCSTNGKILTSKLFDNIYIFPAAADNGVSLGAALYLYTKINNHYKPQKINIASWGTSYSNREIKKILDNLKINYHYSQNIAKEVAQLISQSKIIGWFQGRMEIGPRALGNRSILADPRNRNIHTFVNQIKGRENWRPLAPSILLGFENEYFENGNYSPFMLFAFKVKKEKINKIPAVVHIDNTARPQSVDKNNEKYYDLINHFYKITKIPLIMNTSFNLKNEPIVCRPQDAIKTFYSSSLDYLVLGDYIIKKNL